MYAWFCTFNHRCVKQGFKKERGKKKNPRDGRWAAGRGCGLVRLAKSGSAVGTPSLPQGQAEENAQGEEENGTHDPQTGEVLLQHSHPANKSIVLSGTSMTVQFPVILSQMSILETAHYYSMCLTALYMTVFTVHSWLALSLSVLISCSG